MPNTLGLAEPKQHVSPSTTLGGGARLDTISRRNGAAALEMESLLWRALCDSPAAAKEYLAHDCVMANPLFAGTDRPLGPATEPPLGEALDRAGGGHRRLPWCGFRFVEEPLVVEIDLMAVALVYRISLFRLDGGWEETKRGAGTYSEVRVSGCSSWRQTAGADWLLCSQAVAFAEGNGKK